MHQCFAYRKSCCGSCPSPLCTSLEWRHDTVQMRAQRLHTSMVDQFTAWRTSRHPPAPGRWMHTCPPSLDLVHNGGGRCPLICTVSWRHLCDVLRGDDGQDPEHDFCRQNTDAIAESTPLRAFTIFCMGFPSLPKSGPTLVAALSQPKNNAPRKYAAMTSIWNTIFATLAAVIQPL